MADAIAALPPGWRALDANGNPITDGTLLFFEAGTTTPLPVFSSDALDAPSSLGTSVAINSAGYPVSSGGAKVIIYVGIDPYKIRLTSPLNGGTVFEFDNVRGALDTSDFLTSATVARKSVVETSINRTITVADIGKLINANPTAGTLTMTLPTAPVAGDGFYVGIRHDGTANFVRIIVDGVETMGLNGAVVTQFALTGRGQVVWLVTNGTNWKVDNQVEPLIGNNIGVILIADRLSTPPGSPTPGARYIVTSSPAGAWSTFAVNDIAESNGGGGWFRYTPPANAGWTAYVQSESQLYVMGASSWYAVGGLPSVQGLVIQNNSTTPNTQVDVNATDAQIGTRTGLVDVTINAATTGANGLDTGALANNTWYYIYIISNGTTSAGLLSTSATSPTMPSGYTYRLRVGAIRTGGSATFNRIIQRGTRASYTVVAGSVTPTMPRMANGSVGNVSTPTWVAVSTANYIPTTATQIDGVLTAEISSGVIAIVAPNNNYLGHGSNPSGSSNPPPLGIGMPGSGSGVAQVPFSFLLETTSIYWASNNVNCALYCTGWIDSVDAT